MTHRGTAIGTEDIGGGGQGLPPLFTTRFVIRSKPVGSAYLSLPHPPTCLGLAMPLEGKEGFVSRARRGGGGVRLIALFKY